jgi:shikimate dehydrogenase
MERSADRAESRGDTGLRLTGATRILGLIADPVAQARSPAMASALLSDWGRLGEFALVPLQVPAGALSDVITALRHVGNFAGAIVSMPHKCAILPLLDEVTPEARLVEAVNVIRRSPDARLIGTVMDGEGFVVGLRSTGHDVHGASCLLAGAGGAASAIAFALAAHGCRSLTIVNRTAAKAASLATRVGAAFPAIVVRAGDPDGRYDVAINATSLGMRPDDALPISPEVVERAGLIAECVIAPETTRLLEIATAKGRAIQTGVPMLAAQMELMLRFMGVE